MLCGHETYQQGCIVTPVLGPNVGDPYRTIYRGVPRGRGENILVRFIWSQLASRYHNISWLPFTMTIVLFNIAN